LLANLLEKANKTNCTCGRDHTADIKEIVIAKGALDGIADTIRRTSLSGKAAIICDTNTYEAAGKRVESLIAGLNNNTTTCILRGEKSLVPDRGEEPLVPDEKALGKVLLAVEPDTRYLIAVGSGTINDIVRYVAHKLSLPFISVATAPSMDGYASSVSPLIVDGIKTTLNAGLATVIIGDTDVLSRAPEYMKAAGFGDLIGKIIAKLDWRLANMINGEHICEYTIGLVQDALAKCIASLQSSASDNSGDPDSGEDSDSGEFVSAIMEGLVMAGLGISMIGRSRAASGAEHHISHFLEMKAISGEAPNHLHGEKVSLGTYIMCILYHKVFSMSFAEVSKLMTATPYKQVKEHRVERLTRAFGPTAPAMLARWRSNLPDEARKKHVVDSLATNWSRLQEMVRDELPRPAELASILGKAKSPYKYREMGYELSMLEDAMICSKEISQKYSLLYTLDELGLLEHFAFETLGDLAAMR
jgi:glycerol-1-phosphate dehydrogenase [NAD(P)+]